MRNFIRVPPPFPERFEALSTTHTFVIAVSLCTSMAASRWLISGSKSKAAGPFGPRLLIKFRANRKSMMLIVGFLHSNPIKWNWFEWLEPWSRASEPIAIATGLIGPHQNGHALNGHTERSRKPYLIRSRAAQHTRCAKIQASLTHFAAFPIDWVLSRFYSSFIPYAPRPPQQPSNLARPAIPGLWWSVRYVRINLI